jgi:EmrB/QacA subfamily drug resistance transporter
MTLTPRLEKTLLLATILASSMAFIDSTALGVALPSVQRDLNMNATELLWVVNAYNLFLAALILVGGRLGDLYGRKRIFGTGIVLFAGASLVCGLAPSGAVLIAARAVQGIGGALMTPGSLALIAALFSPDKRGQAIGTWSTFSTLTTLMGPLLGGVLAGAGLWRLVFFINLPLALVSLWALRAIPENRDEAAPPRLDVPGALLVTLGLAGITYGFTEAPTFGFGHPVILLTLLGGAAALVAFIFVESRSHHPMMPLGLFRSRAFSGANALTFFLYAALGAVPFFLTLNLIQVQQYPEQIAGFTLLPLGILLALMSRWAGGLADRIGARPLLTLGPALAGVGFFLFALPGLTNGPGSYWWTYFPGSLLLGLGMGLTVAPLTATVMGSAPAQSSGAASGINNAVARTAGVLAVAILGALALTVFSNGLTTRATALDLPAESLSALQSQANRLAEAAPPAGLSADQTRAVEAVIGWSFVETFRWVAIIGAVLAWVSALLGGWLVPGRAR